MHKECVNHHPSGTHVEEREDGLYATHKELDYEKFIPYN